MGFRGQLRLYIYIYNKLQLGSRRDGESEKFGEILTRYSSYDGYKYNQNKGHHLMKRSFDFDGIDLYGWHIHIRNNVGFMIRYTD